MTFENILYEVNAKMEERAFIRANHKISVSESESLEETVRILGIDDSEGKAILKVVKKENVKSVITDKPIGFFKGLMDKIVYVSGIKTLDDTKKIEKWFIQTCMNVTEREESLAKSDKFTEEEKERFQRTIEGFSPDIQRDLCDKKILLADKKMEESGESVLILYKGQAEMDVLYDTVMQVIPKEFRDVYEAAKYRMDKNCSSSEKRLYLKQMSDILDFDWVNNADYKAIDIDALKVKIQEVHIGHHKQLEEIYTELEASNMSKIAPKTLCLIGHPDTGINQLSETIASSVGRGYSFIKLAGEHMKETDSLIGSSKVYDNARLGLICEHIKEAGTRGVLVIEDYDLYDSEIRKILSPIIEKTSFVDKFLEVKIDLSNMFVIVTCSSIEDIPMHLRANITTIYFQDAEEKDIIETINKIIVPKYCAEFGIEFHKKIPDECCRTLIYKYANMDMNKLDSVIRSRVVKTVTKGGTSFPDYSEKNIDEFEYEDEDYQKIRNEYVRDITATEHKFFCSYDEYPECIQKKGLKLFEILNWGRDEEQKEYARDVIHYIANIFKGKNETLVIGSVIEELSKTHYLQNDFGERIEAAILSKELEKNTNRMTVIGLNGNAGTGKSSTAMSVANAMHRNCIKINVGGAGGAEIIKGTNKTVHNAGPSMIIKELAKSGHGTYSDVLILDEVDKATPDFFNALYEFLDPNEEFIYDQYLECHIPKNNFIVILTFNEPSCIPLPIRDRMEIIEYSNYSIKDKKVIITNFTLPKLKMKFAISELTIDSDALDLYVNQYDVLPGMRNAERDFEFILMRIARTNKGFNDSVNVDKKLIQDALGEVRTVGLIDVPHLSIGRCGMAQALAVTNSGIGVSTAVETVVNPYQEKNVVVTGQLEGSCLESVSLACCYAGKYLKQELPKLHIHFADATKKDGPSAGVAIAMSVLSCLLEKSLPNVAFTGAIDLYGNIQAVGGVFEKCIAAERSSVDKVIIPADSYKMLVDKKQIERLNVEVIPADTIEEVIKYVWGEEGV